MRRSILLLPGIAVVVFGAQAPKPSENPTGDCCRLLESTFYSQVVYPHSIQYNSSVSSYFFLEQRQVHPNCIVQPTTAKQVSNIVRKLALCSNIEVAIRSGGHSPNIGFSNTGSGITLDLRGLNLIDLAGDGKTVQVGTGNQWGDVYRKLDPLGKTVVGARVYDVGIGGFISGGKVFPLIAVDGIVS